jgi:hypothetical protein
VRQSQGGHPAARQAAEDLVPEVLQELGDQLLLHLGEHDDDRFADFDEQL